MSRLWRDQLCVGLYPDQVVLARLARGITNPIADSKYQPASVQSGAPLWKAALEKLDGMLAETATKHAVLRLVLSSKLVRYLALPAHGGSLSSEEQVAYVRGAYHEVYGEAAEHWNIQFHDAAPGEATIAAAIDAELLDRLEEIATQHRIRLASVKPQLMVVFNRLRRQLVRANGYLVLAEPGRLLLGSLHKGRWQNLRTLPVDHNWLSQLTYWLERESWLDAEESGLAREVLICAPEYGDLSLPVVKGWGIRRIDDKLRTPRMAAGNHRYAMALGAMV